MARYVFTPEEAKRGSEESVKTRKSAIKVEKLKLKAISKAQQLALLTEVLKNPAVIGTLLWFLIDLIEKSTQRQLTQQEQSAFNTISNMTKNIPIFGSIIDFGFQNGVQGTLGYAELKLALLAYIATGGNIAGSLANLAGVAKAITL